MLNKAAFAEFAELKALAEFAALAELKAFAAFAELKAVKLIWGYAQKLPLFQIAS